MRRAATAATPGVGRDRQHAPGRGRAVPTASSARSSAPRRRPRPGRHRRTDARPRPARHLERYGAVLGAERHRHRLVVGDACCRTVTGDDVVRLPPATRRAARHRRRGGGRPAPRPSARLDHWHRCPHANVPGATYPREAAGARRWRVATKRLGTGVRRAPRSRPAAAALRPGRARGAAHLRPGDPRPRRVVGRGARRAGVPPAVLVDDRTGAVVQDLDLVEQIDRVVCDNDNDMTQLDLPCTHDFAAHRARSGQPVRGRQRRLRPGRRRVDVLPADRRPRPDPAARRRRGRPPQPVVDRALLRPVPARRVLPATPNAFWNGVGMFYGEGFASADDVVGHEMTHGVIEHTLGPLLLGPVRCDERVARRRHGRDRRPPAPEPERLPAQLDASARTCRSARVRSMQGPRRGSGSPPP